jgi:membrane-associated protease RseP (regulator of RpoE activity)
VLYALEHPGALAVLVLSFVLGVTLRGALQARLATWLGDRRPAQEGRLSPDPRRQVDPFGVVGALISGLGWTRPVELLRPRQRRVLLAVTLVGPGLNLLLGVGLLLAWRFVEGPGDPLRGGAASYLQHGESIFGWGTVLLLAGASQLYLGALALVPLPPLEGGRLLFGLAPRTHGWLRAEHQLVERNIGLAVLLALLIIPLGGPVPLLPSLLDTVLSPLLSLLCGA